MKGEEEGELLEEGAGGQEKEQAVVVHSFDPQTAWVDRDFRLGLKSF